MEAIFEAIKHVETPLALVAFIVAVAAYVYRRVLIGQRKRIEAAPEAERGVLIEDAARGFKSVDTDSLSGPKKYDIVIRLIDKKAARFRIGASDSTNTLSRRQWYPSYSYQCVYLDPEPIRPLALSAASLL